MMDREFVGRPPGPLEGVAAAASGPPPNTGGGDGGGQPEFSCDHKRGGADVRDVVRERIADRLRTRGGNKPGGSALALSL